MSLMYGIALGLLLYCHYYVWINTQTWSSFFFYVFFMNAFGALIGIPTGLTAGKIIRKLSK